MSSARFKTPLAQKVYFHKYLDKLPFGALHTPKKSSPNIRYTKWVTTLIYAAPST